MTENANATNPKSEESTASSPSSSKQRRKTIQFVVLFVVYVVSLLVGYQYAIRTEANMRYLFTTAKHTSALLGVIGLESSVENTMHVGVPGRKRAALEAWRNGEEAPSLTAGAGSWDDVEPLTPYERWLYRAYQAMQYDDTLEERGPRVDFVAKLGLDSLMKKVEAEGKSLITQDLNEDERKRKIKSASERRDALEARVAALPKEGRDRSYALKDKAFVFTLVPDCGAIEVISIFVAAVAAFPVAFRKRFIGIVVGIPVLYGVNLVRLSSLAYLAAFDPTIGLRWFKFAHEYVWQVIFIIIVVIAWLCWIEFVVQRKRA